MILAFNVENINFTYTFYSWLSYTGNIYRKISYTSILLQQFNLKKIPKEDNVFNKLLAYALGYQCPVQFEFFIFTEKNNIYLPI